MAGTFAKFVALEICAPSSSYLFGSNKFSRVAQKEVSVRNGKCRSCELGKAYRADSKIEVLISQIGMAIPYLRKVPIF